MAEAGTTTGGSGARKTKSLGFLKDVSLPALLTLLSNEKQTCVVNVIRSDDTGRLFLERGEVVDATTSRLTGADAAFEILRWDTVEFKIERTNVGMDRRINQSLNHLLLDFCRVQDELRHGETCVPGEELPVPGDPAAGVNIRVIREFMAALRRNLGDGLLAGEIISIEDGRSLMSGVEPSPMCAMFNRIAGNLNSVLPRSGFPEIGRYFLVDLADAKLAIIVPLGGFRWFLLLDSEKTKLGLVLHVVLPQLVDVFEAAVTDAG